MPCSCMMTLTDMPKGGRLPLDFFVIGESTPIFGGMGKWCWRLCRGYYLRRAGFSWRSVTWTVTIWSKRRSRWMPWEAIQRTEYRFQVPLAGPETAQAAVRQQLLLPCDSAGAAFRERADIVSRNAVSAVFLFPKPYTGTSVETAQNQQLCIVHSYKFKNNTWNKLHSGVCWFQKQDTYIKSEREIRNKKQEPPFRAAVTDPSGTH